MHLFAEHLGPACGTLVLCGTVVGKHWPMHSWACDQHTDNLHNLLYIKQQSLILYNQYVLNDALCNFYNQYYNNIGIVY